MNLMDLHKKVLRLILYSIGWEWRQQALVNHRPSWLEVGWLIQIWSWNHVRL